MFNVSFGPDSQTYLKNAFIFPIYCAPPQQKKIKHELNNWYLKYTVYIWLPWQLTWVKNCDVLVFFYTIPDHVEHYPAQNSEKIRQIMQH